MDSPSKRERIRTLIQEGEEILDSGEQVYVQQYRKIDKTQFLSWRTRASNLLSEYFSDHKVTKRFKHAVQVGPGSLTGHPLREALKVLRTFENHLRSSGENPGENPGE